MSVKKWQIAMITLGIAAPILAWRMSGEPPITSGKSYAYDTATKKLYPTDQNLPPFAAPSGPEAGVNAYVVTFAGETNPTVVYLQSYTPAARELLQHNLMNSPAVEACLVVRRPDDTEWTSAQSPEGKAIFHRLTEIANGRRWTIALPP